MSCASTYSGPEGASRDGRGFPRRALEIFAIIVVFFHFWPLAIGYLIWKATGYPMPAQMKAFAERSFQRGRSGFIFADSARFSRQGNHAFEEYRRSELDRLDAERRRLDDEARHFADFVDELKRAKDREEFDAFMNKRRSATTSV